MNVRWPPTLLAVAALALGVGASAAVPATATSPCVPDTVPAPAGAATVAYPSPSAASVTQSSATVLGSVDGAGEAAFEYGTSTTYGSCTAPVTVSGAQPVSAALTGLGPGTTYHFRLVAVSSAGQTLGDDQSFTTQAQRVAAGTTILGVRVGGLTPAAALAKVRVAFNRPLRFEYRGKRWKATPRRLGAKADLAGAVMRSLAALTRDVPVRVSVDPARLRGYVASVGESLAKSKQQGSVRLVGTRAVVVPSRPAIAVRQAPLAAAITRELRTGSRALLTVPVAQTMPKTTGALAIVIRLGEQSLTLYKDGNVVLKTPVTTGRPALPTPVGSYDVAWRRSPYTFVSPWPKGSPYYYPPAPVTWAMFFYDNDFLHDDPAEPASAFGPGSNLGPYASHGCVHVPTDVMRTLYTTVPDHTPVIVAEN